ISRAVGLPDRAGGYIPRVRLFPLLCGSLRRSRTRLPPRSETIRARGGSIFAGTPHASAAGRCLQLVGRPVAIHVAAGGSGGRPPKRLETLGRLGERGKTPELLGAAPRPGSLGHPALVEVPAGGSGRLSAR